MDRCDCMSNIRTERTHIYIFSPSFVNSNFSKMYMQKCTHKTAVTWFSAVSSTNKTDRHYIAEYY